MYGVLSFGSDAVNNERIVGVVSGCIYLTFALLYVLAHALSKDNRDFAYLGGTLVVIPFAVCDFVAAMLYICEWRFSKFTKFRKLWRRHMIIAAVFVAVTMIYTIIAIPVNSDSLSLLFTRGALSILPFVVAYACGAPWMSYYDKDERNYTCLIHASKSAYTFVFVIFVLIYGLTYLSIRVKESFDDREVMILLGSFLSILPFAVAGSLAVKFRCCCCPSSFDDNLTVTQTEAYLVLRASVGFFIMALVYFIAYAVVNTELIKNALLEAGISTTPFIFANLSSALIPLWCFGNNEDAPSKSEIVKLRTSNSRNGLQR